MASATLVEVTAPKATAVASFPRGRAALLVFLPPAAGAIALASGPVIASGLIQLLPRGPATGLMVTALGILLAVAIVPSVVLALLATLSGRPAWQRFALFTPAFALQAAAFIVFWCRERSAAQALSFFWMCPLILVTAAMPALLMRLWRQWVLVAGKNHQSQRPASIGGLLMTTTLWAAAAACTQRVNPGLWIKSESGEESRVFALIALSILLTVPAAFVGGALALALRMTFIRSPRHAVVGVIAATVAMVGAATGSIALLQSWMSRVSDDGPSRSDILGAAVGVGSFCLSALAIGLACFFILRLLGYRLNHRGQSARIGGVQAIS